MKIKDRLNQKLSALLSLVRNSSDPTLLLSAEDHISFASSLLNLTGTKSVAQNAQQISKSPANKHIATQDVSLPPRRKENHNIKILLNQQQKTKSKFKQAFLKIYPYIQIQLTQMTPSIEVNPNNIVLGMQLLCGHTQLSQIIWV